MLKIGSLATTVSLANVEILLSYTSALSKLYLKPC